MKYTNNFIIGQIKSPDQLLIVGEKNLKNGCFNNAVIIDSDGNKFKVLGVKDTIWTFNVLNIFSEYRTVKVNIDVSEPEKLTINEVKNELKNLFDGNRSWYKAVGETDKYVNQMIDDSDSIEHIINKISVYNGIELD